MKYDFETVVDRSGSGASKWDKMKKTNGDPVPAGIIPFSVADMEFMNPPEVREALKNWIDKYPLGYSVPRGSYYDAVVDWMKKRHNWDIKKEWISTTPGVVPALYVAVRTFLKPGEGAITMTPVYYPFGMSIEAGECKIANTELLKKGGHYELDFDDFEAKCKDPSNKLLIFCSPHNPVGKVWSKEELEKIGRICCDNGVLIVSDEIHNDIVRSDVKHTVFATVSEEFANNMIVCTAPSKTFNLAGMQCSNIITPNDEIRAKFDEGRMRFRQRGPAALGYLACETAYANCAEWADQMIEVVWKNYDYLKEFMAENFPQVEVFDLQGTYLAWLDCKSWGMTIEEQEKFMVDDCLFFTDEGYLFGEGGNNFERISLSCPTSALVEGLERIKKAAKDKGII